MLGFPLGLLYANGLEWASHRFLQHQLGKKKGSFWSFHWHEHHRNARRHAHYDADYLRSRIGRHAQGRETAMVALACLAHVPLLPIAPFFVLGAWTYAGYSYHVHKRAHLDPEWAKQNVPWHYEHHMGPNQDMNWCTAAPWFDKIMGTRERYLGTERHARDDERTQVKKAAASTHANALT
jgi:hypothetical protein